MKKITGKIFRFNDEEIDWLEYGLARCENMIERNLRILNLKEPKDEELMKRINNDGRLVNGMLKVFRELNL